MRNAEVPRQDELTGTTIDGRYLVQSRLGEGGMGIVYQARHIHLEKTVAIKVLRNTQDKEAWARFKREATSASRVNHSNIVAITDFGVLPDGHAYLVMEYLEGRTLTEAIGRQPMGTLRALHIAMQIARGLGAVHEAGIIHRDLKPDNVFLQDREGQRDLVKIMDFGIAKTETGARLTAHGMVMGTAEYISPEQASGKAVDSRCDQYALGCILYEMLTGEPVFRAETAPVLMKMHVYDPPVPPRERRPEAQIPASVEAIVLRLLKKSPAERFTNMGEVEQVLQAEITAQESAPVTSVSLPRLVLEGAKRSRAWLLGGVAALLVLGGALVLLNSGRAPPPAARPPMVPGQPVVKPPAPPAPVEAPPPREDQERPRPVKQRPRKSDDSSLPLQVHFMPVQPADILLTCTPNIKQLCRAGCSITIPPGAGQCVASADGFASKPFPYSALHTLRRRSKGPLKLRVSLADLRNR